MVRHTTRKPAQDGPAFTYATGRHAIIVALALATLAVGRAPAFAQLDPLLLAKRVPPTVIVVLDTSFRMLDDGHGNYYDPYTYPRWGDPVANALGVDPWAATYRRVYRGLQFESAGDATKYVALDVGAVPNTSAAYSTFYEPTRFDMAKRGIRQAIEENCRYSGGACDATTGPRWGLVKLRQSGPAWRTAPNCDRPVRITNNGALSGVNDACAGSGLGVYAPSVNAANTSIDTGTGSVYHANFTSTGAATLAGLLVPGVAGTLIPAGLDTVDYMDRPLSHALDDARLQVTAAMSADTTCRGCRNTVVVLVTGGTEDGPKEYMNTHDVTEVARTFRSVSQSSVTKRVPIFVVGVNPPVADEPELRDIAEYSGGRYYRVSDAAGVTRAVNLAVQAGYSKAVDFDRSTSSEYLPVNSIVGTVNLDGAGTATGTTIPDSETDISTPQGTKIPMRSNVMITAGFALGFTADGSPGFDGRIRAFRTFKPETDITKPAGYKFVKDGTALWPDRDGRPETANLARVPATPAERNIYTYVPGRGLLAFDSTNHSVLQPHLGVPAAKATALIEFVRAQPLGGVIGSTPALMDPPSLDPPPDADYGYPETRDTYAGDHASRRAILFFGANDGMIHAVDARTGFEVWAFIPFNLLPKLRTLVDGQPVEQFDYFVDSSPKIAEVKTNGKWKSLLIIGQSMGGTFYQAFDVTEAGMGGPPPESDDYRSVLATFRDPTRIPYLWSFPNYSHFDTAYTNTFTVTDGWPGARVKFFGELSTSASTVERTVGYSWSDPAVGPLVNDRSVNVAVVGSGYFPAVTLPNRSTNAADVGRTLYLIDLTTGRPLGAPASCSTGTTGTGCLTVPDVSTDGRKNALQADPTAAGSPNGTYMTKAYLGDVDGTYWRFDFTSTGSITRTALLASRDPQPIYASSALMLVGSTNQYVFFATGSDLLPISTPGGAGPFTLYGLLDQGASALVKLQHALAVTTSANNGPVATIERASTSPSVAGDIVFFTTTTESYAAPCTDFSSKLYGFTYLGGAAYDTDNSGSIGKNESPVIQTMAGRASAPFVVDQHLYVATTSNTGVSVEAFGDPEDFNNGVGQVGVRILSWRELR